jgi:hypothetical protein
MDRRLIPADAGTTNNNSYDRQLEVAIVLSAAYRIDTV